MDMAIRELEVSYHRQSLSPLDSKKRYLVEAHRQLLQVKCATQGFSLRDLFLCLRWEQSQALQQHHSKVQLPEEMS